VSSFIRFLFVFVIWFESFLSLLLKILIIFLLLDLVDQLREVTFWVFHQGFWAIIFSNFTIRHDHDFIRFNNGLKSMGNSQHCASLELLMDELLDLLLSFNIDVGCSFIKDHNLVLPQNGTADLNQWFFTRWKVITYFKVHKRTVFSFFFCGLFLNLLFLFAFFCIVLCLFFLFFLFLFFLFLFENDFIKTSFLEDRKN